MARQMEKWRIKEEGELAMRDDNMKENEAARKRKRERGERK